jgi:ubiquinone/menaquinone biosynthesis C-methylase UbiE
MAKDLFSSRADVYAKYRPAYPLELFDYIVSFVNNREAAWDCATGNGQAANALATYFRRVEATDISEAQLQHAVHKENIHYSIAPAEQTTFPDNSFDLITVATAYHWLDWEAFHREATRVGKRHAVVAVWAYNLVQSDEEEINNIIRSFYFDVMFAYWDKERRHVENAYQAVAFDFAPLPAKDFFIEKQWKKEELIGYVSTWSAVQHYQDQKGGSPLPLIEKQLAAVWTEEEVKTFRFPLFMKIGRVRK